MADRWTREIEIKKVDEEQHTVFGWASVSVDKNGEIVTDLQGDQIASEVLEKTAYEFVIHSRRAGDAHERSRGIGTLIESAMITKEKAQAMGIQDEKFQEGWWIGFKIDDADVWAKVKGGKYAAFSIGGRGKRSPVEPK